MELAADEVEQGQQPLVVAGRLSGRLVRMEDAGKADRLPGGRQERDFGGKIPVGQPIGSGDEPGLIPQHPPLRHHEAILLHVAGSEVGRMEIVVRKAVHRGGRVPPVKTGQRGVDHDETVLRIFYKEADSREDLEERTQSEALVGDFGRREAHAAFIPFFAVWMKAPRDDFCDK